MASPRTPRRSVLFLGVLLGVLAPAAARAELLVGALTDDPAPGERSLPGLNGEGRRGEGALVVYRPQTGLPCRGAWWVLDDEDQLRVLQVLAIIMTGSPTWIYPQIDVTPPAPQVKPRKPRDPPPINPPPHLAPEPSTLLLGLLGGALAGLIHRRQRQQSVRTVEAVLATQMA